MTPQGAIELAALRGAAARLAPFIDAGLQLFGQHLNMRFIKELEVDARHLANCKDACRQAAPRRLDPGLAFLRAEQDYFARERLWNIVPTGLFSYPGRVFAASRGW